MPLRVSTNNGIKFLKLMDKNTGFTLREFVVVMIVIVSLILASIPLFFHLKNKRESNTQISPLHVRIFEELPAFSFQNNSACFHDIPAGCRSQSQKSILFNQ